MYAIYTLNFIYINIVQFNTLFLLHVIHWSELQYKIARKKENI